MYLHVAEPSAQMVCAILHAKLRRDPPHDAGGEIGISRCCVTTGDHLHHLHDFAGQADL